MAVNAPPAVLGAAGALLALLLWSAPSPVAAITLLADVRSTTDPTTPVVAVVALAAWTLGTWLGLAVLATTLGHLPGLPGRVCAAVARRVAPSAIRRAVEVALGLGLATGALGAGPASAAPLDGHAARSVPATTAAPGSSGTAVDSASVDVPSLDWPRTAPRDVVVVRPGDTLWALAEQSLRSGRSDPPTDAAVARAWPAWWAANREVIGDDPDLLRPGTVLSPPPGTAGPL